VINDTVFTLAASSSAPGPWVIESIVWTILFWAWASRAEVYPFKKHYQSELEEKQTRDAWVHQREGNELLADEHA